MTKELHSGIGRRATTPGAAARSACKRLHALGICRYLGPSDTWGFAVSLWHPVRGVHLGGNITL